MLSQRHNYKPTQITLSFFPIEGADHHLDQPFPHFPFAAVVLGTKPPQSDVTLPSLSLSVGGLLLLAPPLHQCTLIQSWIGSKPNYTLLPSHLFVVAIVS
jgi:hypothetical protein